MPASTSPNWAFTAGELCHSAAKELGAIGVNDTLDASEAEEMMKRLNGMLAKMSKDANLFRETTATITITGGTGAATLPAEVRGVRSMRYVQSATYKRTLAEWNRDQYFALPNRAQAGVPTAYYYSHQVAADQIYVWPVPAADASFEIDYSHTFFEAGGPDYTLDIPTEWYEVVLYGLASRSANIFGSTTLEPSTVARIDVQARKLYEEFLDADRPDAYVFEYDECR